jgi:hypothetical protein
MCRARSQSELKVDNDRCMALGYPAGSAQLATCLRTASEARKKEKDRQTQSQIEADRVAAAKKAESDRRDEAAREKQQQDISDIMSGNGDPFDTMTGRQTADPDPLPSAAAIPGMVCTGEGDDASCDALSEE